MGILFLCVSVHKTSYYCAVFLIPSPALGFLWCLAEMSREKHYLTYSRVDYYEIICSIEPTQNCCYILQFEDMTFKKQNQVYVCPSPDSCPCLIIHIIV